MHNRLQHLRYVLCDCSRHLQWRTTYLKAHSVFRVPRHFRRMFQYQAWRLLAPFCLSSWLYVRDLISISVNLKNILRQASEPDRRPTASPTIYWAPGVHFCESSGRGVYLVTDFHVVHRPRMHGVIPPIFYSAYRWWRKHRDNLTFQLATVAVKKGLTSTVPVLFSTAVQRSKTPCWATACTERQRVLP